MSTKKKNTNVDTKKKGAAEKSPSNSVYEGVIPGLSMVASSSSLAPSNNVKKTTGSIASTAKKGSTRKIEEAYEQRVASQMASPKTGRVPTNAQLVEAPKVDNYARNEEIISQYESIPSYNAFERLFDRDKKQAYDTKQTMYSSYSKALSENYGQALRNAGFTDEDLYNAFLPGYATEEAAKAGAKQYNEMMKHDTAAAQQFAQNYIPEEEGNRLSESLKKKIADAGIDVDRAQKYFQNWKDEKDAEDAAEYGKEHKAETLITTGIAAPFEGAISNLANRYSYLTGNVIGNTRGLEERDITRQGATSDMGKIPGLVYGAGGNLADMAAEYLIGGPAGVAFGQGMSQANSVVMDAAKRGLTPNQIMAEGDLSGLATAASEWGALGKIQDIVGSVGGNFLTKTLASGSKEGLQEVFESLINSGIDQIIGGKNADLTQQYNAQIAAGASKADAALNTAKDYAVSLLYDFLGGAIAGGALGAGGLALNSLAGNNNQTVQHETTNTVLPGMGDTVEQSEDNVPQTTAQRIEELAAQIQPETETEVQGESAPRFNEPETLSIKPVDAPADYAFTLPEAEVNQIDMQMEARTAEIADIFVEPSFGAMEFTREDGSRYIASKSTRDGVEYQLSFIDSNGDPVSHSEYQGPVELAEAVNDLTWNKDYEYHVLNNQATEQLVNDVESVESTPEVSEQATEAEEHTTSNSAPISTEAQPVVRANPEDVVYHAGVFSKLNKAETNGQFAGSNRDTGYFGTGHYFVDGNTINEINTGNYAEKPLTSVDISGYNNLFRADTDEKAKNLHYFLSNLTKFTQGSKRNDTADLYSDYLTAFKGQENIIPYDDFVNRVNSLAEYMQNSNMNDRGDSVSTQFMKSLGYGGVDTRGTNYADTRYGTVIYDVDENSVLQGNVPADQRATTDMLTRSENRNVYDADEDARIQAIFDKQARNAEIEARYNAIYDSTELRENEQHLEELYDERKEVMSIIEDVSAVLRDPEGYVAENNKLLADMGLTLSESETAEEVDRIKKDFTESLNERMAQLESINQQIAEAESVNDSLLAESNAAWEQARADQYSETSEPVDKNGHTVEQKRVIEEYNNSADDEILNWFNDAESRLGTPEKRNTEYIAPLTVAKVPKAVSDYVKTNLGVDNEGNNVVLDKDFVSHEMDNHLVGRTTNLSKSNITEGDISKIAYVLQNPDEIVVAPGKTTKASLKDGTLAPKIMMRKRIDGHYYVLEVVSDGKKKRDFVVNAFIEEAGNETDQMQELFSKAWRLPNGSETEPLGQRPDAIPPSPSNLNVSSDGENVNSEPTYLGAVPGEEISEEEKRRLEENGFIPEDDFEDETEEEPIDENQPLIENGQVTRNGVDFIRNRWKPEQKTLKDTPYDKQFLGIRQALTSNNMGKNDGSRQFTWAIAAEIRQYLQDRDRTHLENAQIYADYIDNVIAPYEQGKAATITGAGGRKWTVEEGTQNISGRTAALIDQVIADENREVLNDLPEEIQAHMDALEGMKDPVSSSTKFALDQFMEEYENAIIRMKVNHESPDGKTFDRITNLATNAGQIIKQQEKQLRGFGYDPEDRFTEAYYLEHVYPLIDFFDQTHHEIYDSNLEVDVPVEEDAIPGLEQTQETEAEPLLNEVFEQEEAQPRPREMAMDVERETGNNGATFAEITIDPETGEEDYERGPNDRPEPGENWEKRYRGAVYEDNDTMKVTQAARNTLYSLPTVKNNPAVQEYLLQLEDNGTFRADVVHNADSVAEAERILDAAQKLQGNVDGVLGDILSENTTFDEMSPVQQDTLMMGLDMKLEEGLETGDFSGAAELLEKTNQRQHKIGQLLQALGKYTHTASSAIAKATAMIDDATEDYPKWHKIQAATNGKLARALETMGNKYADRTTPKQPISHEEMLKRVRNTLEKESASVDELLTDSVIEQITALVESDIPMWQLRDELEHFFNRGEFYTIDESTEQKKARSQKLANALREVTEGKQERVVTEKTVEQIESEIEALLDSEYASIRDEFSDDDISYLANRIKNGAEHAELVDALNQKMATGSMGFTNEELAEVVQLYKEANSGLLTSREEYEAMQKANAILASHLGKGTVMERLNQWRYLSMLISPSTHMKNIASNATWSTVTMLKDTLAAGMEAAAEAAGADIERTKSVILPTAKDRALVKEAYDSFDRDVYAEYARGGSKYNDRNEIKQQQRIGSRFVNKASEINSGLLEKEDIFAGRMKYTQALAGYLKANGADASIFSSTDPEDRALLKKAEDYALAEANKATFHEENKYAKSLSNLSRTTAEGGMMGLNAVVEGLVPFKKTTSNIARQFLYEYNPVTQVLHGVPKAIYNAVNNGGNVAEVIDNAAKGMTGAGLVALGAYLASQGILVATGDDDDKDDVLGKAENFAITWFDKDGNQHYYTIDGMAPTAMLLTLGAELVEGGFTLSNLANIGDSFVENSLLSGFKNMWEDIAYSIYDKEKNLLFTALANVANNYVSQFVPTAFGKVARSIDKTSRSTYTGKKGNMDTVYRYGKKLINKIPVLSMLNEPRVDAYGNEVENVGGNFFGRLLYNLTSIGYYSKRERDDIQKTIANLDEYAESLEGDARDEMEKQLTDLITAPDKSFGGEKLSPKDYTEYSKITGQTAVDVFNGLISNEIFQEMTPEDQAGIMDQMGLFARNLAKREFFGTTSQSYEKLMELYDDRDMDGVMEYLTIKSALDGNTSNAAAVAAVQMSDMSIDDKAYYLSKFITNPGKDAQAAIDALGDNGLYYWYSTCSQSTKKEDRYRAIAMSGYSDEIKSALTKIVYNSGKDTPADTIPSLESLLNGTTQDAKGEAIRSESGDEIADQYYSAKDYIKTSADSMGVSTSNTAAQIDGLKQLDVDDETKGYYLETIKGTVSKKALAAGAELGDAGIYYWYSIYTEAQAQYDSSPTKKEVQSIIDASDYPDDVKAALTRANNAKK